MQREHEIVYSPTFHRHLVVEKKSNGTRVKRNVVQSFLWLDQAEQAFPFATIVSMDPPPPPPPPTRHSPLVRPLYPLTSKADSNNNPKESHGDEIASMVVAGAGLNETSVYYHADKVDRNETNVANRLENGASYLLKFLHKLQPACPSFRPADLHRDILDRFPRLALYDAALVHERLFYLLSPLPPEDVIMEFIENQNTDTPKRKTRKRTASTQSGSPENSTALRSVDWPFLFYERGYGVGLTPFQLLSALQTLPEYWLPIYLNDASSSMKQPHKLLPYIFSQLKGPTDTMCDARQQLDPWLVGASPVDVASIAHAKSALGLSWLQCSVLVQSLPTMVSCDTDPSWDMYERGPVRSILMDESLSYLRLRLQLSPFEIFGLIKTHTRLSSYKVQSNLKPTLDALQEQLSLTSEESQRLVLRLPSLLGMSTARLDHRITFLRDKAGLSFDQVRKCILKFPALLQYGDSNLEAKVAYFSDNLQIREPGELAYVFSTHPSLWGLSLENNIKPTILGLAKACRMTTAEVGQIVARAPELLSLNWGTNLKPTLEYLQSRLNLTRKELKEMVKATPRVLLHSINMSLEVKLKMLDDHFREDRNNAKSTRSTVIHNPSLLLVSRASLEKRLRKAKIKKEMVSSRDGKKDRIPTRMPAPPTLKFLKTVRQLSPNSTVIEREFLTVKDAATAVGTSASNMYNIISKRRIFRGMIYEFGKQAVASEGKNTSAHNSDEPETALPGNKTLRDKTERAKTSFLKDLRRRHIHDDCQKTLMQSLDRAQNDANSTSPNAGAPRLVVYVSGRVYPPDASSKGRGFYRSGGMAISIPSLPSTFSPLFEKACQEFGSQVIKTECRVCDDDNGFVALIGFPYLNASRRRVSLAACVAALRLVGQLFFLVADASKDVRPSSGINKTSCPPPPMHIDVISDSNYAWGILSNSENILEWGSQPTKEDYDRAYSGKGSYFNHDILYGLSLTYKNLVQPQEGLVAKALEGKLTVSFVLESGQNKRTNSTFQDRMAEWATEAAVCLYRRRSVA